MTHQFKKSDKFWPKLAMVVGLLISASGGYFTYHYYLEKEKIRLELTSNDIVVLLKTNMAAYEQALRGGVGFFNASDNVSRDEWAIFVKAHKVDENFKGIQGLGYSEIVLPKNKQEYEERIRKEGFTDFKIYPDGQREVYTSIIYLEPFNDHNKKALGYDMFSEKVRRDAMIKAMQSGEATLSGKVTLVQEYDTDIQAEFLMYLPVYKKGFNLDTPQERTLAIQGFVYAPFRINDLMQGILSTMFSNIDFEIYDGNFANKENILYDSITKHQNLEHYKTTHVTINGRTWTFLFKIKSIFKCGNIYILFLIPLLLLALTLLLYVFLNALIKAKGKALQAAQKLHVSKEKYHAIFNTTHEGIVILDLKSKIFVDVNATMCQKTGYSYDEFIKLNVSNICPKENLSFVVEQFEKMLKSELKFTTELPVLHKDGSIFFADVNAVHLNLNGKEYLMGAFRDITKQKRADKMLRKSEEMMLLQSKHAAMGEMISMIAHQWRQPLNIIGLAVANIQTKQALDILDDKTIEDNTVIIADNITFMSDTIDDFRNYFKPDSPKELTKVQEVIDTVLNIMGKSLENNDISLTIKNNSTSSLFIHKSSLVQVLINIVSNAKDALISNKVTPATINITVTETQYVIILSICDNAGGIPEDIMNKIHEPYFSTKALTGTGLGLYISRTIVEKHLFGTLAWHNEDKGACFVITLLQE